MSEFLNKKTLSFKDPRIAKAFILDTVKQIYKIFRLT